MIGAGEHATVHAAAQAFLREAEGHVTGVVPAATTPLPAVGRVSFLCAPSMERWGEKQANRSSVRTTIRSRQCSSRDIA